MQLKSSLVCRDSPSSRRVWSRLDELRLHRASTRCGTQLIINAAPSSGSGLKPPSRGKQTQPSKPSLPLMHQNQTIDPSKEAHKIFDEVFISVRSGDGGNGEVVESNRGKMVDNFKYNPGGSQPKRMWLPASDPADGANGADVILICDPALGDLLHLHEQAKGSSSSGRGGGVGGMKAFVGRRGSNANPAVGSGGPKNNKKIKKASTPPLIINVPPGTVVKRKSNGVMLGELLSPGDSLVVARGGEGGRGVRAPTRESNQREMKKQFELAEESGAEVVAVEDNAWKQETHGLQGEQFSLHLTLRVVADVGIVGYPNAGKSSLLASMTRARPEIASYPFTTLMPNLGVMGPPGGGSGATTATGAPGATGGVRRAPSPVLADLPGLIDGAHKGKGLGRMFLRHLGRTRVLLHVVDASAQDPATDYYAVREELRMYNPDYVSRPHVVALNKMDLEDAGGLKEELCEAVRSIAERHREEARIASSSSLSAADGGRGGVGGGRGRGRQHQQVKASVPSLPSFVVPVSAQSGEGMDDLRVAISATLARLSGFDYSPSSLPSPRTRLSDGDEGGGQVRGSEVGNDDKDEDEDEVDLDDPSLTEEERNLLMLPEDELERVLMAMEQEAVGLVEDESVGEGGGDEGEVNDSSSWPADEEGGEEGEGDEGWGEPLLLSEGGALLSFQERRERALASSALEELSTDLLDEEEVEGEEEGEGEGEDEGEFEEGSLDELEASVEELTEEEAHLLSLSNDELEALIQDEELEA